MKGLSWNTNEPSDSNGEDCAELNNGRFNDIGCEKKFVFACQHPDNRDWKITSQAGAWEEGGGQCKEEYGSSGYTFSVPANGYEKNQLMTANTENKRLWLNYSDHLVENDWQPFTNNKKNNGITLAKITDLNLVWKDSGSGADDDISIWRAGSVPGGYYRIGDVAIGNHHGNTYAIVVKALASDVLKKPNGYSKVWDDSGSGADDDVAFWRPTPPGGYVCLGDVATNSHSSAPSTDLIRCVKSEYTVQVEGQWVWDDSGSGADDDAGVWEPAMSGRTGYEHPRVMRTRDNHDMGGLSFFVLDSSTSQ